MGRLYFETLGRLGGVILLVLAQSLACAAPDPVVFAPSGKVFSQSVDVALSCPTVGATIFYTTDGSVPSAENGTRYASRSIKVSKTSFVRAIAVAAEEASEGSGEAYVQISPDLAPLRSTLPVIIIETFGKKVPAKGWSQMGTGIKQVPRLPSAWLLYQPNASGVTTLAGDPQSANRVGIRQRGSFSSTWRRKPYSVEVWDETDDDKDVELLGMPEHSDWNLYYPDVARDKDYTMIYNAFMWRLSAKVGRYAPRFRWVEVYLNSDGGSVSAADRQGVYALVEKVSRDENRVPFKKLAKDGTTGGWMLSINRMDAEPAGGWPAANGVTKPQFFHTAGPDRVQHTAPNSFTQGDDIPTLRRAQFNFESPGGYKITAEQRAAIEGWFKEFEDVLYDDSKWLDPENGYRKYIDDTDFADFFLFNNLAKNYDGLLLSIYPWRSSEDGKLRLGPTWDFNWACYEQSGSPTHYLMSQANRLWFGRLFQDPDFLQLYVTRWQTLRKGALSDASMTETIDTLAKEIGAGNAVKQGIASAAHWKLRLATMKEWLRQRAKFFDSAYPQPPKMIGNGQPVAGARVQFSAGSGTVYYTTDGSDPRASGGAAKEGAVVAAGLKPVPLIGARAAARAFVPSDASDDRRWMRPDFDDRKWKVGKSAVGYDEEPSYRARIGLDLQRQMARKRSTAYIRIPFEVAGDPANFKSLTLSLACDDGFAAWINGTRVASFRAPETLSWSSRTVGKGSDAETIRPTAYPLDAHLKLLRKGTNVLAIQGLNAGSASSDFLIEATLAAGVAAGGGALELKSGMEIVARTKDSGVWSVPLKVKVE